MRALKEVTVKKSVGKKTNIPLYYQGFFLSLMEELLEKKNKIKVSRKRDTNWVAVNSRLSFFQEYCF